MFSKLLREILDKEKISRTELANKLKTSPSSVTQVLKSKNLAERTLVKYATALGYSVEMRLRRKPRA